MQIIPIPGGGVIINYFDDKLPLGTKLEYGTIIGKIKDCCKYSDGLSVIAIGDNHTRKEIAEKYKLNYTSLIHPSAIVGQGVTIGEGTVVMPNAVINANTAIGEHCIINTGAVIEHDNIIEDYVHISPNCSIGGTVKIGQCTHIGIGATVKNNITIKENIIIGAGAVAITDISESGIYVGVPARRI